MMRHTEPARAGRRVLSLLSTLSISILVSGSLPVTTANATPLRWDPLRETPSAGELQMAVERLGVVGSVLYVAAHPDDENTRLLAWLAGHKGLRAAYVSLTRGDGGQNLIGLELGPLLGLIRTHELLAARRIDGAEQFFTRALDFGYSKTAKETLSLWGAQHPEAVLADLVQVVRRVRPDLIVTRFSTEPPNHGHHIASALLAREAFDRAAEPGAFPEQLAAGLPTHAATRLIENKSHWRFKEGEDLSRYQLLDVGTFSPLLGKSFAELAAASRTMHKSQGFGSAPVHGSQLEYFEVLAERSPPSASTASPADPSNKDPLAGLDFTWRRFPGTSEVTKAIEAARRGFVAERPHESIPRLVAVRRALERLPSQPERDGAGGLLAHYRSLKLAEVDALLLALAGIYLDVRAKSAVAVPGEAFEATATALLRTGGDVRLVAVGWPDGRREELGVTLAVGRPERREHKPVLAGSADWSTPFWLREPRAGHLFRVDWRDATTPVGPPELAARFELSVGGVPLSVEVPARLQWVDPIHGERFRPVEILPPVTVTPRAPVLVMPNGTARRLDVRVAAHGAARKGRLTVAAPAGWTVSGEGSFALASGEELDVAFKVTPPSGSKAGGQFDEAELRVSATLEGDASERTGVVSVQRRVIDHTHIPTTTVLSPAVVRARVFPFVPGLKRVGYVMGPGDEVADGLAAVGYEVTPLSVASLDGEDLSKFEAIVVGVRAFNHEPSLVHRHAKLMRFVERGGTLLVQYQVSSRFRPLGEVPIGPRPFTIGQGRVTDEGAAMRPLRADHPIMARPNRLEDRDFEGWVQERGLYFAERWDDAYEPVFELADPDEAAQRGAVIVARHGQGTFIYTGISFFRQLPDGVPGAYRLFANLLGLGRSK